MFIFTNWRFFWWSDDVREIFCVLSLSLKRRKESKSRSPDNCWDRGGDVGGEEKGMETTLFHRGHLSSSPIFLLNKNPSQVVFWYLPLDTHQVTRLLGQYVQPGIRILKNVPERQWSPVHTGVKLRASPAVAMSVSTSLLALFHVAKSIWELIIAFWSTNKSTPLYIFGSELAFCHLIISDHYTAIRNVMTWHS